MYQIRIELDHRANTAALVGDDGSSVIDLVNWVGRKDSPWQAQENAIQAIVDMLNSAPHSITKEVLNRLNPQ